jgi:hypothetical protein
MEYEYDELDVRDFGTSKDSRDEAKRGVDTKVYTKAPGATRTRTSCAESM